MWHKPCRTFHAHASRPVACVLLDYKNRIHTTDQNIDGTKSNVASNRKGFSDNIGYQTAKIIREIGVVIL